MAKKPEWVTIKIPASSGTNKLIEAGPRVAAWKIIEEVVVNQPKTKHERAINLYEKFIEEIDILYPGHKNEMNFLRGLIFKRILKLSTCDESENLYLNDEYYEILKKL